jgi:hypothetical protein
LIGAPSSDRELEELRTEMLGRLPEVFLGFAAVKDGAEGYLREDYYAAWSVNEVADGNRQMEVETYLPGLTLFASNGLGDAYGFDARGPGDPSVVLVPMIGMDWDVALRVADTFEDFFAAREFIPRPPAPSPEMIGKDLYEIHPVAVGGSPTDPDNKRLIERSKHVELAAWWNREIAAQREG